MPFSEALLSHPPVSYKGANFLHLLQIDPRQDGENNRSIPGTFGLPCTMCLNTRQRYVMQTYSNAILDSLYSFKLLILNIYFVYQTTLMNPVRVREASVVTCAMMLVHRTMDRITRSGLHHRHLRSSARSNTAAWPEAMTEGKEYSAVLPLQLI